MRKTLLSLVAATGIVLSTISPANATSSDSLSAELSSESSSLSSTSSEGEDTDLLIGVVAIAAVGGLIASGVNWAVQQRMIPNPLPGIIPNPPAPRQAPAPAPQPAPAPAPAPRPAPAPAPAPRQAAPAPAPAPAPAARSYRNCTEVWNTLGRPIRSGEAGYGTHLDRDRDGVGCESRPR
ncbi:excalibur calcium-binding domain-containing protein [Corynebacterium glutamicum]|uniref:excalibur calcium-binding domain-containing protein n=1 Tax=Corynebacterium glutamicum TaxID=1718 RepID=UPI000744B1AF|nr:excalibur calcium-binding domain-containing protein [Corynebacterium glutamicum]AMA00231.1 hypothetical protein APT58_08330 [Corynebacterium glutamicum]